MQVVTLQGNDPRHNLAEERRLFEQLRTDPAPLCLYYVNSPSIILGRNNQPADWVNLSAAEHDGIPIIRRFSGGGTVYHDAHVLNYSFIAPRSDVDRLAKEISRTTLANKYIAVFISLVIRALGNTGAEFQPARLSDINLNGRKISGNAQRIARELVLHHGTLMLSCPLEQIVRYLPLPPDRPGVSHRDFVTGLAEEGLSCSRDQLQGWISAEFTAQFS